MTVRLDERTLRALMERAALEGIGSSSKLSVGDRFVVRGCG